DCRPVSVGPGQREPATLLLGRLEDAWLRNRRTAGMEAAGQRGRAHGGRLAHYENREGLQRAGHARLGRGQAGEVLWRAGDRLLANLRDRKSTRLNSSHVAISYDV